MSKTLIFIWFLLFAALGAGLQYHAGAYGADRGNHADEAAHFVSSVAISDYLASGRYADPVGFAKNYYAHFPKVAIGHWPPFFETLQALVFLIFGGTGRVGLIFEAVIAGICAVIPATILGKRLGWIEGLVGGLIVLLSPVFLPLTTMDMADTLVAATVTLAAIAWSRFYSQKNWRWCLLFALAASAAILTKGNAFGLALMPPLYLAIKRDPGFLFMRKTLAAAAIVGVLTLPWYILTYRMAADGFVYHWGWSYSHLAVPFFAYGLVKSVGVVLALCYALGILRCVKRAGRDEGDGQIDVTAFISASIGVLVFTMVAPADMDIRYLIAVLPCVAIVAVLGLARALRGMAKLDAVARPLAIAIMVASILVLYKPAQTRSFQSGPLVNDIMSAGQPNPLILMSGNVMAEGAFIASFAEKDRAEHYYVIRAQKALADSNWMASNYTLKFSTPAAMARWIGDSKIGWLVVDTDANQKEFPHNAMLKDAIAQKLLPVRQIESVDHPGGRMILYSLPAAGFYDGMTDEVSSVITPGHLGGFIK